MEIGFTSPMSLQLKEPSKKKAEKDQVRVQREKLQAVLEQCQRALELLSSDGGFDDDEEDIKLKSKEVEEEAEEEEPNRHSSLALPVDREADELCDLLKSSFECPDFSEKLECAQVSFPQNISAEDVSSWDMVNANDLWESENGNLDQADYVLVQQEDIVDGIACFMAACLLSLKQSKDLTPNELQEALSKTFTVKKKKGKLRKAWDGSKVIYNVASWGATAIGIYQNPVLLRAASEAFWTSCHVVSKLL